MKKIILALLLVACFQQLRAQALWNAKPADKLTGDALQNAFKPVPDSTGQQFFQPKLNNTLSAPDLMLPDASAEIVYSRMPVVKTQGYDHMPVIVPGEPGVKYMMLVKKIEVVNPGAPAPGSAP